MFLSPTRGDVKGLKRSRPLFYQFTNSLPDQTYIRSQLLFDQFNIYQPAGHRPWVVVTVHSNLKITIFIVPAHLPTVCQIKATGQYWPSSPQS